MSSNAALPIAGCAVRERLHTRAGHAGNIGMLSASLPEQYEQWERSNVDLKQPSATFPGFRHLHRSLMPGETIPRAPTLLEQLQALRSSSSKAEPAAEEQSADAALVEDQDDEEWSEVS